VIVSQNWGQRRFWTRRDARVFPSSEQKNRVHRLRSCRFDDARSIRRMRAIDQLNARFGRGAAA
jgi:hypothetical protein